MKNVYQTRYPTPALNRPDFDYVFGGCQEKILLDEKGLLRALETVILEGERVKVNSKVSQWIVEIEAECYPVNYPIYTDCRFLRAAQDGSQVVKKELPKKEKILSSILSMEGLPYIWGGNYSLGIDQLRKWYPIDNFFNMSGLKIANWTLSGVDCSGMMYEATNGLVPRNTSWMMEMGEAVEIEGKSDLEIAKRLKPLDAILWHTHVLFVLDSNQTIESRASRGYVFRTPLLKRLGEIKEIEKKKPMNTSKREDFLKDGFIVRRWYSSL